MRDYMREYEKWLHSGALTADEVKELEAIEGVLRAAGRSREEIRWFVCHQANERIVRSVAKRLKQSMEKFPINMEEYGNTSSASIPILLDNLNRSGALKSGEKIILSGFGAGLSYGASLIEWKK